MRWIDLKRFVQLFCGSPIPDGDNNQLARSAFPLAELPPAEEIRKFISELKSENRFEGGAHLYKHPSGIRVLCQNLDEINLGGKAAGLITLARFNLSIPATLLISSDLYREDVPVAANMTEVYENSRQMFLRLGPAIVAGCRAAGIRDLAMIRSSGFEDLEKHTAAGVFESYPEDLRRNKELVAETVQTVALSAYPGAAAKFCVDHGVRIAPIPVMINQLVYNGEDAFQSAAPYLSMTVDTSDPEVITAAVTPGLGSTIANGRANCVVRYKRATGEFAMRGDAYGRSVISFDRDFLKRAQIVFERPGLFERFSGPRKMLPDPVQFAKVLERIAQDVDKMESKGFGLDIELAIQNPRDLERGQVTYLQRRVLPQLDKSFRIPFVSSERVLALGGTAIGQGVVSSADIVRVDIPSLRDWESSSHMDLSVKSIADSVGRLCPEGFIYFFDFPGDHCFRGREEQFQQLVRESFRGARAIIVRDQEVNFDHLDSAVVMSHFAQFFRSEGIPIYFGSEHQLGQAFREFIGSTGDSFTQLGPCARHFRLPIPLTVACDQRKGIGIVAIGES